MSVHIHPSSFLFGDDGNPAPVIPGFKVVKNRGCFMIAFREHRKSQIYYVKDLGDRFRLTPRRPYWFPRWLARLTPKRWLDSIFKTVEIQKTNP